MKITDNQDMRLKLLFGNAYSFAKQSGDNLHETVLTLLANADEGQKRMLRKGSPLYSASRHMAIKALIKELETGEPVTDPVVQVATEKLERIGDSIFMRKVK